MLRIAIGFAALVLFAVIFFTSRRRPGLGRRAAMAGDGGSRQEPTLRELLEADASTGGEATTVEQSELDLLEKTLAGEPVPERKPAGPRAPGARPDENFDKVVSLFLAARAGQAFHGPDLVVAAEKAGLVYGHMNIFHRLVDNHPEQGPVFSVANLVKPGHFDMASIQELRTPGISFFMALPGPLPALDAWDAMLPTAQRMAELLDGVLLDEERNALGRQRIAHIREDLRNYDRKQTKWDLRTTR
ncbi:cell division protein ZipA [Arenimonas caeni]|jgi:cell division protein ZipA|uniref:cell division protein ZipA n=1 Tax=Arenimonas caeni TaxID=2058085 RepID=UPI002A370BC5|nr:cell division protein ZipA [Arenimonas caeni]MDY0021586.1 cell division protein ZipA [Arenimonas caeni]